jgi:thiol-disulfide isomerase/thioredoxin
MKKLLLKKSNIFLILLLTFVLFKQFPVLKNNFSRKDEVIPARELKVFSKEENETITFPPKDSKAIAIFWASWCGPCKFEMARLKKSVESGSIPRKSIFAINPFESNLQVEKFLNDNNYPFTFIEASSIAEELGVKVTPTTLFIDKGRITEMSSGMSIWGIWKAELYL